MPKVMESALPLNQSHDAIRGQLMVALMKEHGVADRWTSSGPWIMDVFPSNVVYQFSGQTYKRTYTLSSAADGVDPTVTLGEAKKIHVAYVDTKASDRESLSVYLSESAEFEGLKSVMITPPAEELEMVMESSDSVICLSPEGFTEIKEAKAGTSHIPIKIIGAGWGSSAYYPKEVLQRDGPKIFKKGTHMMWNHATESEEVDRPEGSLTSLAAVFIKDAYWNDNGPKGAGLYTEAKVFSDYAQQVSEKGPYIGVSINAGIKAHEGSIEGRSGRITDQFVKAFSTDFVTKPGAGGAPVVPVTESNRGQLPNKETDMKNEADLKAALEAEQAKTKLLTEQIARLQESQNHTLAVTTVGSVLREAEIDYDPDILNRICINPTMKEGSVDAEWVKGTVKIMSKGQQGRITGTGRESVKDTPSEDQLDKDMRSVFESLGVPKEGLDIAVRGGR